MFSQNIFRTFCSAMLASKKNIEEGEKIPTPPDRKRDLEHHSLTGALTFLYSHVGVVLGSEGFDTYGDPDAGVRLRDYLNAINGE